MTRLASRRVTYPRHKPGESVRRKCFRTTGSHAILPCAIAVAGHTSVGLPRRRVTRLGPVGARGGQRGRRRRPVVASGRPARGARRSRACSRAWAASPGCSERCWRSWSCCSWRASPCSTRSGSSASGAWHRLNGTLCLALIAAHTVLITAGYAPDRRRLDHARGGRSADGLLGRPARHHRARAARGGRDQRRSWWCAGGSPTACGTPCTSAPTSRSRSASATSSRPVTSSWASRSRVRTGGRCTRRPWRRSSASGSSCPWRARCATSCGSSAWCPRRPASSRWRSAASACDRLRVLSGQSLHWRFLARGHWWETHPFSLSAAPDGRRLRITVKELGDYTRAARLAAAGHARDRRGPVGRADERGAAPSRGSR